MSMSSLELFCNNCGNYGHVFYQCKRPITSIGIIPYRYNNNLLEFLMVQRKDSLGFVEIIRGKYNIQNMHHLQNLFNELTTIEINMLNHLTFDELWIHLWGVDNSTKTNEYTVSLEKFTKLKNGITNKLGFYNLETLINNIHTSWKEPEWGFPKGRRNYQEKDLDCALREYAEETGFNQNSITLIDNLYTMEEIFTGSNLKSYKHKYYIGKMNYNDTINVTKYQKSEIGNMKWLTYDECIQYIRPYNIEKKKELEKINTILKTYRISI